MEHIGVFLRTPYNYDRDEASQSSGLECKDPTRTQQHFAEETDINTIVERFKITGQLPENVRMPTYADFDEIYNFQDAMNAIRLAEESFAAMPANVRRRFNNDPAQFLEFCYDDNNREEAIRMGLVPPREATPPIQGKTEASPTDAAKPA